MKPAWGSVGLTDLRVGDPWEGAAGVTCWRLQALLLHQQCKAPAATWTSSATLQMICSGWVSRGLLDLSVDTSLRLTILPAASV